MEKSYINVHCINCQCMSSAFKKLLPEQLRSIENKRSELKYRKGEMICKDGSFVSSLIFIKKGLVKIYFDRGCEQVVIGLKKSGDFIGLSSIYEDRLLYSAEALEDTDACITDVRTFNSILNENSEFSTEIIKLINKDIVKIYDRMYSFSNIQIRGRFAELLLLLMENIYESNPFELKLSRKVMAEIVSTSNESISRLAKEFKSKNIIKVKGRVFEISDIEELRRLSIEE